MADDMFNLNGKVALITGGHSYLGYDMATVLAEHGANIIIASRNENKIKDAAAKLNEKYSIDTTYIVFDQTDPKSIENMAAKAFDWKKHIDILINNSGGGSGATEGDFLARPAEAVISLITTNLIGALLTSQAISRYMVKNRCGKIINIGSIAGIVGRDRSLYRKNNKMEQPIDYAASKAGVIGMTRDMAAYLAEYNIQVNTISPGGFDKGDLPEGFVNGYSDLTMKKRMGIMGQDIKGAALFLSSPASDYITGHNLVVDGGFSVLK